MIKLKRKTELRHFLLNCENTTGAYKVIQIFKDGDWSLIGINDDIYSTALKIKANDFFIDYMAYGASENATKQMQSKAITEAFKEIEEKYLR